MTKSRHRSVRGYFVGVHHDDMMGWRAELWWNPYDGWLVAATRWVMTKPRARQDGRRVFGPFMRLRLAGR